MPINDTVTNSGKISLQVFIIIVLVSMPLIGIVKLNKDGTSI